MEATEIEKAYIAGFFDGEGCIIVRAAIRKNKTTYELMISVGQNDTSVLKYIQRFFGGRIANPSYEFRKKNQTPDLRMESKKAADFLRTMLPYLRVKKPQAELALKFQELVFPRGKCRSVDLENMEERKGIHEKIRHLNRSKFKKLVGIIPEEGNAELRVSDSEDTIYPILSAGS